MSCTASAAAAMHAQQPTHACPAACQLQQHLSLPLPSRSELHARCRVHPPSELMRLALRKVLPLQWHQEWRSMQGARAWGAD